MRYLASPIVVVFAVTLTTTANAQSFSCPIGKQASCLDYSDKVCSYSAKCVRNDAVCFDSFTCDFKGFICKSEFDDVVEKHNKLVRTINDLQHCLRMADSLEDAQACSARY